MWPGCRRRDDGELTNEVTSSVPRSREEADIAEVAELGDPWARLNVRMDPGRRCGARGRRRGDRRRTYAGEELLLGPAMVAVGRRRSGEAGRGCLLPVAAARRGKKGGGTLGLPWVGPL